MDLKGTTAIITGGNGGLGQRICHALADAGSNIAVVYAQSKDEAEGVAKDLSQKGIEAAPFQCDVSNPAQIDSLIEAVSAKFNRIDILINDAAFNKMIPYTDLDALTLEIWNKILAINLTGPMLLCKTVAPAMKKQGKGRIVNISSVAGLAPVGSSIAYAVSKAGLNHLTKCMSVALAPEVLVNGIAPGFLEGTRATANLHPSVYEKSVGGSLLKIPVDKDDIADQTVAFCRTDTTTGQTLVIDSGRIFH